MVPPSPQLHRLCEESLGPLRQPRDRVLVGTAIGVLVQAEQALHQRGLGVLGGVMTGLRQKKDFFIE